MQDRQVHGGGTLVPAGQIPKPSKLDKMKEVVTVEDMHVDVMKIGSSEGNFAGWNGVDLKGYEHPAISLELQPQVHFPPGKAGPPLGPVMLPEGRVHGGSLMALLASSSGLGPSDENQVVGGSSEKGKFNMMPHTWMM